MAVVHLAALPSALRRVKGLPVEKAIETQLDKIKHQAYIYGKAYDHGHEVYVQDFWRFDIGFLIICTDFAMNALQERLPGPRPMVCLDPMISS